MYKKLFVCVFIVFSIIIIVNEYTRTLLNNSTIYHGVKTIHSNHKNEKQCTWICHHQTNYCKKNHVQLIENFKETDKLYNGLIKLLQSSKNYALANIIILGLVIPFLILYFLFQSIKIQEKIRKQKNEINS